MVLWEDASGGEEFSELTSPLGHPHRWRLPFCPRSLVIWWL